MEENRKTNVWEDMWESDNKTKEQKILLDLWKKCVDIQERVKEGVNKELLKKHKLQIEIL